MRAHNARARDARGGSRAFDVMVPEPPDALADGLPHGTTLSNWRPSVLDREGVMGPHFVQPSISAAQTHCRSAEFGHSPTDCRYSVASAISLNSRMLPTFSKRTSRTSVGVAKKNSFRALARLSARSAK